MNDNDGGDDIVADFVVIVLVIAKRDESKASFLWRSPQGGGECCPDIANSEDVGTLFDR